MDGKKIDNSLQYGMRFILVCFFVGVCLMQNSPSYAAPSMAQDECTVKGTVTSEAYRKTEDNGIPGSRVWYHDIVLDVSSKQIFKDVPYDQSNCKIDPDNHVETYQIADEPDTFTRFVEPSPNAYVGKCIQANTRFFADDFGGGNWLSEIKILTKEECQK